MIPVDGHKNLYRDEQTGAIVNLNQSEYNNYVLLREQKRREKLEIQNIKNDIQEIKSILYKLIENKNDDSKS